MSESCQIEPLARVDLAEELEDQVRRSLHAGASLELGGGRSQAYFESTIVSGVEEGTSLWSEETFGPVAAISVFKDEEEMIRKARHRTFGLGITLCTQNMAWAGSIIPKLEEGDVFINEMVKSDPRLPFGGVKSSGYGRELSKEGILAFVNTKTVFINH